MGDGGAMGRFNYKFVFAPARGEGGSCRKARDKINTLRVVGLNDLINFFSHFCEGSNFGGGENYVFHLPHSFSPRAPLSLTPTSFLKGLRALYFEKFISLRDFIVILGVGSGRWSQHYMYTRWNGTHL